MARVPATGTARLTRLTRLTRRHGPRGKSSQLCPAGALPAG